MARNAARNSLPNHASPSIRLVGRDHRRNNARLQCFPDSWEFSGSVSSQYRQIGNAVPVNLGYHIGLVARTILGHKARKTDAPCILAENEVEESGTQLPLF